MTDLRDLGLSDFRPPAPPGPLNDATAHHDRSAHMTFSERAGLGPNRTIAQFESIDAPLRHALWIAVYNAVYRPNIRTAREDLWDSVLGRSPHEIKTELDLGFTPSTDEAEMDAEFAEGGWARIYDIVEKVANHPAVNTAEWAAAYAATATRPPFADAINAALTQHNAAYRLVAGHIVALTSTLEIAEVATAAAVPGLSAGASRALNKAIELFADRQGAHHANVVAESINAVESVAREVAITFGAKNQDTLGKSLIALRPHLPASRRPLLDGWGQVFGFTSQTVRHGGPEDPDITAAEAQFFLVSASAFINLLLEYSAAPTPSGADA